MEPGFLPQGFRPNGQTNGSVDHALLTVRLSETTLLLEVLAHVNALITQSKTFEAFCMEISKLLQQKLKFHFIQIWIRDEQNKNLLRLVTPETHEEYRTMTLGQGLIGKCIREAQTICAPDVRVEVEYSNIHATTKSELCAPLICESNIIGAINIETETYNSFDTVRPIIDIIAGNLGYSMKLALLYKTEERFHRLVDHMSEGVWVGDSNHRTIYTNPTMQKMMSTSAENLLGMASEDYFEISSRKTVEQENAKRKLGQGGHYEAILVSKTGEKIPVLVHGVPFGNGGSMGTVTDLRPLKQAQQKLTRTENFLSSITQYCPEAIVGLDNHDIVQSWNVAAERMFGFKAHEIIGKPIQAIIPEERIVSGEADQINEQTKARGFVRNFETVRLHKNGTPIHVSLTLSTVLDENGKIIGLSVLYRDVTTQKKWERELQDRFEKMQDAYREMGKQRRYLDYLTDIIQMATSGGFSTKQIGTYLVNAMVMTTKVNAATLRMYDRSKGKLMLIAQSGAGEEWWSKKAISYSGSLLEQSVNAGQPLKILDVINNPKYTSPALAQKNNLRSALIIPLQAKGIVLGSLSLYLSHEADLSLLDDEFITVFAKQAALALTLSEQK